MKQPIKQFKGYSCDPETGVVYGIRGKPIRGVKSKWGHLRANRGGIRVSIHVMIWIHVHGSVDPGKQIDHINGDPADNRIANLRLATPSQNQMNRAAVTGVVPYKGVCWNKSAGKFQAQIKINGRSIYLGLFLSAEEAHAAYAQAAKQHFGEFARAA